MPFTEADHEAMRLAIAASRQALAEGNRPFGATLLSPAGRLLWTAHNHQVTGDDCTAHAEMVLVHEASAALGPEAVRGGNVYASGEPCAMCAGAMFWAGVRRVLYAVPQAEMAALLGGPLLPVSCAFSRPWTPSSAGASPAIRTRASCGMSGRSSCTAGPGAGHSHTRSAPRSFARRRP